MSDESLPWSEEAEQSVLGALLVDNGAFDRVGDLLATADFFASAHRAIFTAISVLIVANRAADQVTVAAALRDAGKLEEVGGLPYLEALAISVPSASNIRRYAEIVRERSDQRDLHKACDGAAAIAREQGDAGAKVDRITTLFGTLERRHVRQMPRQIAEVAIERTQHYEDLEAGRVQAGWPTRIPRLDTALTGGLRPGSLYILAARPSVGKTSLAMSLTLSLAKDGLPALFLSQEMPLAEISDRAVSSLGHLSHTALLTGKMDRNGWGRVSEAIEGLGRLNLWIDDQATLTLQDIRLKAKACKGLKILVIDYLQLCAGQSRDGNRNAEIEQISRGLKALAKELSIAVIALSQLNRDVEKRAIKRPLLSDLRDSGAIEQDADAVLFLWPVRELGERKIIGIGVDKNRQGASGIEFGLDFTSDQHRWGESTADIRPPLKAVSNGAFE